MEAPRVASLKDCFCLLFSLLCANEWRVSAAGRALPINRVAKPGALAEPGALWKTAYSSKGKDYMVRELARPTS